MGRDSMTNEDAIVWRCPRRGVAPPCLYAHGALRLPWATESHVGVMGTSGREARRYIRGSITNDAVHKERRRRIVGEGFTPSRGRGQP